MIRLRLHAGASAAIAIAAVLCAAPSAQAQTAPSLGSAQSFAVLGGSTVTNTGASVVTGDLGVSPGSAVTGFPPGVVVSGTTHAADAVAGAAQSSVTTAYNSLAGQACTQDLTGQDLGGKTLTPGVYCFSSTAQLTGTLTLNALGNPSAVFIFKVGSALTTASGSSVVLLNSAAACTVFWQIGSSATLGTSTAFVGNILALTSITLNTGATVSGRTLARNGAVTLDTSRVTAATCAPAPTTCPALTLSPSTLPAGTLGTAYSQTLTASGGTAPYVFSVSAGTLPAGLTLSTGGVLAGTPTTAGTTSVTIRATDAAGCLVELIFTITITPAVACPVISLVPATLPAGTIGTAYNQTLTASGGTAPYTFRVTAGALPAGLTLSTAGVVAGTPTAAGTTSVTVRATDANGCFIELTYSIVVAPAACPPIILSPATVPTGTIGSAYNQTITGSGGTAPYVFTVSAGTLPAGITLTSAGVLAGTPTTAGTTNVTIRGTDANGCFAERTLSITVVPAVPTLPQTFLIVLALALVSMGYLRLRRRAGTR